MSERIANFLETAVEKGYPAAWFSWLEYLGVIALLVVAYEKTDFTVIKYFLGVLIGVSSLLVYLMSIHGVINFLADVFPNQPKYLPSHGAALLFLRVFAFVALIVLMFGPVLVIVTVILGLIEKA